MEEAWRASQPPVPSCFSLAHPGEQEEHSSNLPGHLTPEQSTCAGGWVSSLLFYTYRLRLGATTADHVGRTLSCACQALRRDYHDDKDQTDHQTRCLDRRRRTSSAAAQQTGARRSRLPRRACSNGRASSRCFCSWDADLGRSSRINTARATSGAGAASRTPNSPTPSE